MYTFLIVVHLLVSFLLVITILMQASKGGGLSGAFGGTGASSAIFGGRGAATFLSKVTTSLAVAFMVISVLISLLSAPRGKPESIIKREADRRSVPSANLPIPQGSIPEGESPVVPFSE